MKKRIALKDIFRTDLEYNNIDIDLDNIEKKQKRVYKINARRTKNRKEIL